MDTFKESPYWQDFWRNKSIEKNVALYALAPFFQEAAALLHAAARLWHPWSLKRKEEMGSFARSLAGDGAILRQRALSWACQNPTLSVNPVYVFGNAIFSRRHSTTEGKMTADPEATSYLVSATVQTLFMLLEMFEKISEKEYDQRHWIPKLSVMIETLMESSYIGTRPVISREMIQTLAIRSVLSECEGLAYTMARIEDKYNYKNKSSRRKRSGKTDAEISALAAEIGVDFSTLKNVFETEYSSWWKVSETYRKKADAHTALFLIEHLDVPLPTKTAIRDAWDPGRPEVEHLSDYFSENEMGAAENIIKTFISMFLAATTGEAGLVSPIPDGRKKPLLTVV